MTLYLSSSVSLHNIYLSIYISLFLSIPPTISLSIYLSISETVLRIMCSPPYLPLRREIAFVADLVSDRNRVLLLQMDSQIVGQKVEETGRGEMEGREMEGCGAFDEIIRKKVGSSHLNQQSARGSLKVFFIWKKI